MSAKNSTCHHFPISQINIARSMFIQFEAGVLPMRARESEVLPVRDNESFHESSSLFWQVKFSTPLIL